MSITGSNNSFACNPVVFANANSIVSLGTITRDGNQFTFSVGFVWKINGVTYQNTAPVVITIAEASEGFNRIDNALLNTSNTIELQQGLESETIALKPVAPDTNIILTSWNISVNTIGDTETPIVGTQFKKKDESRKFSYELSGIQQIIQLSSAGHQHYSVIGDVSSIAGFGTSLLSSSTAEQPYSGKDIFLQNEDNHDITLLDAFLGVDIPFDLSSDLIIPPQGIVWFKYNQSPNRLTLFMKSWNANYKSKSENLAYNDSITTGSSHAYFQPNGESIYAFSNEDLSSITGFRLDLIDENSEHYPYPGKDILIYNNKAGNLTLKHDGSGTADVKFLLEGSVDLVVPPGGKVWLKYGPSYCELIFKSWSDDYLKKDISTYTPATTPLSGTEKVLIHDGTDFKEVAVSEFIYTTDSKSYESLSSAMAVIPLPENNTIFYVDESNLTERGVYAYDSGEVGGYRFVRDYTPNGIVEEGNTKAVSGGEVFKSEKSIKDEMRNFTTLNGVIESLNGYYSRYTGAFVQSSLYKSIKFTISENTEYYASNDVQGNLTALAIFYNASGNILGSQLQGVNGVKTTYKRRKLTIPAGTVKIGLSGVGVIGILEYKSGDINVALRGTYSGTLQDLNDKKADSEGLFELVNSSGGVPESVDGYYARNTGVLNPFSGYKSENWIIDTSKEYYANGVTRGTSACLAVFYGASNNWLGNQNQGGSGSTTYKRQKLTFPAGTVKIGLSSFGSVPELLEANNILDIAVKGGYVGTLQDLNNQKADKTEIGKIQTICAIGDSISRGSGSVSGNYSWCNFLANKLNASLIKVATPGHSIWLNLLNQIKSVPANQDLITVMIGVNDITKILASEIVMGNIDTVLAMENNEPTNSTLSTLYNDSVLGRFRWCMEFLTTNNPNSQIFILSPFCANRPDYEPLLEYMRNGQEKISYLLGSTFLKITSNDIFSVENFTAPVYLYDTLHPTDLGYRIIGGAVYNFIK